MLCTHPTRFRSVTHRLWLMPALGLLAFAAVQARAQTEPEGEATSVLRSLSVTGRLTVTETLTNNVRMSSTDPRSELITQISPSVSVRSEAGRVQGSLNYSLNGFLYARESDSIRLQHALSAAGSASLVDEFAFVDASARVSTQNILAFGSVAPDGGLLGGNQSEVKSWSVSPHVRGRLGGVASYEGRIRYSQTDTGVAAFGDSANTLATLRLASISSGALLNWSVQASHQESDFSLGRRTETDQLIGTLGLVPGPAWRFTARAGREISNLVSLQREGHPTYGLGLAWTPSSRTSLAVDGDHHYYGNTYSIRLQYRTPRTAWVFSDVRSIRTDASPSARGAGLTEFELLFLNLTSRFPDPIERAQQALLQLLALGIDPTAPASDGFLTSAASMQRGQHLSVSYLGRRTDLVVSSFQTWTRRLDTLSSGVDSLSGGVEIRQRGISASASHRLTPGATLTANVTVSRTPAAATGSGQGFRKFMLSWQEQISQRMRLSLSARHTQGDSAINPYDETALIARLSLQF